MKRIELSDEQFNLIKKVYELKDYNKYDYDKVNLFKSITKGEIYYYVDFVNAKDLLQFVDDKKIEHGLDKDDEPTELGYDLTSLWDYLYYELNH